MPDKYSSFQDLAIVEKEGTDYRILVTDRRSPVLIMAPHGGTIEPGSSEVAAAIAANDLSIYCFEGLIPGRPHNDLHVTSAKFFEPRADCLIEGCEIVVGIHGRANKSDAETVWMGGRDTTLRDAISESLAVAGFKTITSGHDLPGEEATNICNRGRSHAGVQLEIPRALRNRLVAERTLKEAFAAAVRAEIARRFA